jgi:hypothetical protein
MGSVGNAQGHLMIAGIEGKSNPAQGTHFMYGQVTKKQELVFFLVIRYFIVRRFLLLVPVS